MLRAVGFSLMGMSAGAFRYTSKCNIAHAAESKETKDGNFDPNEFRQFTVISTYDESPDTKVVRIALPEANMKCNLVCASCIVLKTTDKEGKNVIRPYTPITHVDETGYFEIMVKKYKDSKMGTYVHSLVRGDKVNCKGPFVKIPIKPSQYQNIGMLCGGTGIAPMFQVCRELLRDPTNKTQISMIFANRRKEDILLGNQINEMMMKHKNFNPYFVLSKPPSDWMGGVGHINKEMIKNFMPPPEQSDKSILLVSGPPGFMASISGDKDYTKSSPTQGELTGCLKEMGYTSKQVFKF
eukprot:Tbor_TRINITY_DN4727_c0_g2::TRINITY_DN4727_c0_g2_i1::g.16881::m.16881/K00326/E1.6.2.2; cytochrome-b5 reductase